MLHKVLLALEQRYYVTPESPTIYRHTYTSSYGLKELLTQFEPWRLYFANVQSAPLYRSLHYIRSRVPGTPDNTQNQYIQRSPNAWDRDWDCARRRRSRCCQRRNTMCNRAVHARIFYFRLFGVRICIRFSLPI